MLIVALLASAQLGAAAPDWVTNLRQELSAMNENIQREVQSYTQNLQREINSSVQWQLEQVRREIENLPKDAQGRIITSDGHSLIINDGTSMINSLTVNNGISKMITSGRTKDGEPYIRIIEERRDGNYLYHNETSTNPKTNVTESIRWKLDLNTPGAKPEIITE